MKAAHARLECRVDGVTADIGEREKHASTICRKYLAARLAKFSAMHPLLRIELVTATRPLSLIDRETDVAVNMTRPEEGSLRLRLVGEFDVCLYASPEYVQARGDPMSVEDLCSHDFVGYVQELQAVDETRWLGHWIQAPKIAFASSSLPAQLQAVISGAGIAALPVFMARNHAKLRRILAAHSPATRRWWLVTRTDDKPIRRLELLCNYVGETMRSDERLLRLWPLILRTEPPPSAGSRQEG